MEVLRRRGVLSVVWVVGKSSGHVEAMEDVEVVE